MMMTVSKYCGLSNGVPAATSALLLLLRRRDIAMTLAHALRLMLETFGGAFLMLAVVWTVVAVEERVRLLIDASPHPGSPQTPSSTPWKTL